MNAVEVYAMTFFDWLIYFFIVVPVAILWVFVLFDIFGRVDLTGGQKALWVILVFIFPFLGALIYLAARPAQPQRPASS